MRHITKFSTNLALGANVLLFVLKIIAGLFSGSIALISDAINSLTDIIASIAIFISVRVSHKKADHDHPFGHHRAEPIGGMVVAIVAALLGFEIIKESIMMFFADKVITFNYWVYGVVIFTIFLKYVLYIFFKNVSNNHNTPAVKALSYDSINDVFVTTGVLISFILYKYNLTFIDALVGFLIGIWIIRTGIKVGLENIDYLMGKKPCKEIMDHIKESINSVSGVKGMHDVLAHYVGSYVHVEVHIELNKSTSFDKAHDIGDKVREKIETLDVVDRAFIHIDPV